MNKNRDGKTKVAWKSVAGINNVEYAVVGNYIVGNVMRASSSDRWISSTFSLGTCKPFAPDMIMGHKTIALAKTQVERQLAKFIDFVMLVKGG